MSPEQLTPAEAARLLDVSEATVHRWIRQGLFHSSAREGTIARSELVRWARAHGMGASLERAPGRAATPDLLADAVARGAVASDVAAGTAAEAIEAAVGLVRTLDERARAAILDEVLERERMASTGLGSGVALPHPRRPPSDFVEDAIVAVVYPARPLDWAAVDDQPVHAVFLLLSPSARIHLQLLARVAYVLREPEFGEFLRSRPGHEELVARLRSIRKGP